VQRHEPAPQAKQLAAQVGLEGEPEVHEIGRQRGYGIGAPQQPVGVLQVHHLDREDVRGTEPLLARQ
jgi:hypothetical protein